MGARSVGWPLAFLLWVSLGCREDRLIPLEPDREGDAVTRTPKDPDPIPPGVVREGCPPLCPPPPPETMVRSPAPNPIPDENQKPGDPTWRDGRHASEGQVELYLAVDSVEAGDQVAVKVSTSSSMTITAEVFRLGHYGGAGARKLWAGGPFATAKQQACPRDKETGRVECAWKDTFTFQVDPEWVSGLYIVKVRRPDGFKRFAPLVVRDSRRAELLFQPAFNTYQAYNTWGGESLYSDASGTMPSGRAYHVSYDRPYQDDEGAGQLLRWELPFISFLEQHGYDVTYTSNLDFTRFANLLDGVGAFVHAGHDEYWTQEARDQVDQALASGRLSLAHFGGNGAYWRTRVLSSSGGGPLRTLVCYKNDFTRDPIQFSTLRFRDDPVNQPENGLFGTMYDGWQLIPFPLVVTNPSHWVVAGTGLRAGDLLHGLVGYEFDKLFENIHAPFGISVVMESPVVTAEGIPSRSQVVSRALPSGTVVFSAGTIYWPLALSNDPEQTDGRVMRMTLNVLERALAHVRPARSLPSMNGPVPAQKLPDGKWATRVVPAAGIAGFGGHRDGAGEQALFNGPTGLAVTAAGAIVVADTLNNRIRMIQADANRTVVTIAGNGESGGRDGTGASAMFRGPTGVAIGKDGAIYVADSDNHAIRRIEQNPPMWTVTTVAGALRKPGFADGAASAARFRRPTALAADDAGNLYVADQSGHRIRKIRYGTGEVSTIAGGASAGFSDAPKGINARFNNPSAIAVGPGAHLYVMDAGNQRVRWISSAPPHAVVTLAGRADGAPGFSDGTGVQARFRAQMGITFSRHGEILLADTANFRIRKIVPGADRASTFVYTHAGSGRVGRNLGSGEETDIVAPAGLAYSADGRLFVADAFNHVVREIVR